MATIDVAIPNYNYGRYLGACVDSVLAQDVEGLRILIIDNASEDGSQEIARALAARHATIELLLRSENKGQHASFNDAIDWARGDYFVILCSDDLLPPGALKRAMAAMDAGGDINLTYGRTRFFDDMATAGGDPAGPAAWHRLSGMEFLDRFCRTGSNPLDGPTAVVRTTVQKQIGHYRSELPHTDDMEMWMRFSCRGAVAEIDAVQTLARIHGANRSAVLHTGHLWNMEQEAAFDAFFAGEGGLLPDASSLRRRARRALATRAYLSALAHLARGQGGAFELMRFALTRAPRLAVLPPLATLLNRAGLWRRAGFKLSALVQRLGRSAVS